jgi:hypothetical protein
MGYTTVKMASEELGKISGKFWKSDFTTRFIVTRFWSTLFSDKAKCGSFLHGEKHETLALAKRKHFMCRELFRRCGGNMMEHMGFHKISIKSFKHPVPGEFSGSVSFSQPIFSIF